MSPSISRNRSRPAMPRLRLAFGWAALVMVGAFAGSAQAQVAGSQPNINTTGYGPAVPNVRQRSGLYTRHVPIQPRLPVDRKRDRYHGTKWLPRHRWRRGHWVNSYKDGGMYGLPLSAGCTECDPRFFQGAAGASTMNPGCRPRDQVSRVITNFIEPFRPVGSYYDGGCHVPVYDLDPLAPGPGWFPWWVPDFANKHIGG